MAQIEGFRIQNYKALKDITLGKLWNTRDEKPLTKLTVVIGKNGSGKSSIFVVLKKGDRRPSNRVTTTARP